MPNTPLPAPPRSSRPPRTTLTDEDRERVAALLAARFADDSLSLEEFEERVAAVYRAASQADLDALTAGIAPAPVAPAPPGARAVAPADAVPASDRRFAVLANLEHHSMAVVPRHLAVSAIFGNIEIDLRDAQFGLGPTEIHVRAVFGHIAITLPAGAQLDQQASGILGSVECLASPLSLPRRGAPVVRLTGRAVLGAVEIRYGEPSASPASPARIFPRVDRPRGRR